MYVSEVDMYRQAPHAQMSFVGSNRVLKEEKLIDELNAGAIG